MPTLTRLVLGVALQPRFLSQIQAAYPDLEVLVCPERERLVEVLPGAQALVGWGLPAELLAVDPALRWFHFTGAGVDGVLNPALIASEVLVTNNSGVHGPNIAEHLLALMLAFARDLPALMRAQLNHDWIRQGVSVFELGGQTLGVVGLGDIGQDLAWRANALGMRVLGLRRHAGPPPRGVERVYPPEGLRELLQQADHLAITLPLTPRTHGLIGAAELAAMRPSAYIYNIGRGAIIDQDALLAALQAKQIAGAGLDVTEPEPLPPGSPLWSLPNVIITDHTSGRTPRYWERAIGILLENIGRFRRDEPMLNLVDKREGY